MRGEARPGLRRSGALRRAMGHSVSGPARAGWRRLRGAHQALRGPGVRGGAPRRRNRAVTSSDRADGGRVRVPERFERAGDRPDAGLRRLRREARAHPGASPPSVRTESGAGRVAFGSGLEAGRVAAPLMATTSGWRCSGPQGSGRTWPSTAAPSGSSGSRNPSRVGRARARPGAIGPPKVMTDARLANPVRPSLRRGWPGARPARAASRRVGPCSARPTASCRGRGASP